MADRSRQAQAAGGIDVEPDPWRALSAADLVGVLDRLSDGIIVLDRESRVIYMNEPAGLMAGRPHTELLEKRLWAEFPELVGGPLQQACEEAMAGGEPRRLVDYYPRQDSWFESRLFPQEERLVIVFRDVSDERQAEEDLRQHVDRISETERTVRFGVWRWDVGSGKVTWSEELHRIYGIEPGSFGGTVDAFIEHVHPADRERIWASIQHSLETLEPFAFEERIARADGSQRVLHSQGRVLVGADGAPEALVGLCHDVTDRALIEQALGASERQLRAIVDNSPSMITVKDLEGRYLMSNAETERVAGVPAEQIVGMHCSDVFPAEIAAVQRLNDQRAAAGEGPVYDEAILSHEGEPRTYVTVTFALPDDEGVVRETCTIATDVTERRRREGERQRRSEWTEMIGSALAEGRFLVYVQPIFDLAGGQRSGCELLVRMRAKGEEGEILAPDAFLPAAERYELIQAIDVWMVEQAIGQAEKEPHVNVSAVTMCDPVAREEIVALLAAAPAAARGIVFEVTETASVVRLEAARAFARQITAVGCRLALDDFGVGFGSFTYLRSLPLSFIKIDSSFVRRLAQSADDRRVVGAIVGIARQMGMETVAEGVEDEATLALLNELGVDQVQGFHLGRPAPLA